MRQRIPGLLGILFLIVIGFTRSADPWYLFFIFPFFLLFLFYLISKEDQWIATISTLLILFFIFRASVQVKSGFHFSLLLVGGLAFLCFFYYQKYWTKQIEETEIKLGHALKDKKALDERHLARIDSLKHLEERVSGLVHLFEIARDLNECISLSELLHVLDQKISEMVKIQCATLILNVPIHSEIQAQKYYSFGPSKKEDNSLSQNLSEECLKILSSSEGVVRFDSLVSDEGGKFVSFQAHFPVWLFPLTVERQLIAALVVEGGNMGDFQKFEILATQLALQVKKVQLYERVKEISIIDGLTQVFVRRHFFERFQEELKRATRYQFPLSVLMVDVDHFKSYNDKFGHLVGDKTLREVAQVIRDNVRRVDVIGRYGGEEFIVAAPEINKAQGVDLAERIRSAVARKKFQLYDEEAQVTVSVGVGSFPEDLGQFTNEFSDQQITELIEKADRALYQAKQEGRNRVVAST